MRKASINRKLGFCLASCLAGIPLLSDASTTVTVKVTVIAAPSCIINDNRPIEVNFSDVITTRVDGSNYRMPVPYSLSCSAETSNAMKLQIQGNVADFDNTVLQTNKTELGIELQQDDSKVAVNHWLNFTYPNQPQLWAVPVKQSGATLTGGEFSATATMKVDYQ